MQTLEHSNIRKLTLDVTNDENIEQAIKTVVENEGRIDVLVNNAGVNCAGEEDARCDNVRC